MLEVKTPDEVLTMIREEFVPLNRSETVPLSEALGRILAESVTAGEYVPDFDRSTVDGYALRAADTFGCSDAIPAILPLCGEIRMGEGASSPLPRESCVYVPTGGALPSGADCAVMLEYTEDFGDGTIGVMKPGAPGMNVIFRGDDVFPGKELLPVGHVLTVPDIGAFAAIGKTEVLVSRRPKVGLISTGDELVPPQIRPGPGQVRDVNSALLSALFTARGAEVCSFGIVVDDEALLREKVQTAVSDCDVVILSGGSSVGVKDAACRIIESMGELLLHGIAVKPGKPTILGKAGNKPLVGLPGHPVAAYFVSTLFVLPLLDRLSGRESQNYSVTAYLTESVGANHGRSQITACRLQRRGDRLFAEPIHSKSGLITQLVGADGFFCIERDCEGLPKGAEIQVFLN